MTVVNRVSLRVEKRKKQNMSTVDNHNYRRTKQKNIDPDGVHYAAYQKYKGVGAEAALDTYIQELPADMRPRIIEETDTEIGKNTTTVAVEIVISATPTYFRDKADDHGVYDKKKTNDWIDANVKFLKEKFGENLLDVTVHLDEKTPHMHANVAPLEKVNRKKRRTKEQIRKNEKAKTYETYSFNAAKLFNKAALQQLQTEAYLAVEHLGIERGIKGSKLKHQTLKQFYAKINEINEQAKIRPKKLAPDFSLPEPKLFETAKSYKARAEKKISKKLSETRKKLNQAITAMLHANEQEASAKQTLQSVFDVIGVDGQHPLDTINNLRDFERQLKEEQEKLQTLETKNIALEAERKADRELHERQKKQLDKAERDLHIAKKGKRDSGLDKQI